MMYSVVLAITIAATVLAQTTPDGTCSGTNQFHCQNSPYGSCCSSSNYCGNSPAHCGGGCQPLFGTCAGSNESPDNSCGGTNGFQCFQPKFECCSDSGYCGNSTAYCGGGCQAKFSVSGFCLAALPPTNSGRCGPANSDATCAGSPWDGQCCSVAGYCGTSIQHCSKINGCQGAYGAQCQDP